ncbi:MAG TPA: hypothetical protein VF403_00570 [Kofleriaceae bacterium]
MRAWLFVCVLAGAARADDLTLRWETKQPPSTLELDPVFQTTLAHFDETEALPNPERTVEAHRIGIDLGDHTHATFSSAIWATNEDLGLGIGSPKWHASGRIDHDFGHDIHLEVDASVMELAGDFDGRYGRGTAIAGGIALTKYIHWSHGRVAWISLGVDLVGFLNGAPVGVPSGATVGVHVGTTF